MVARSERGPVDGAPILFAPSRHQKLVGFGSEHLEELGIRLVSIDRPGLGQSDLLVNLDNGVICK